VNNVIIICECFSLCVSAIAGATKDTLAEAIKRKEGISIPFLSSCFGFIAVG
jgi:hypothetical protein